MRTEYRFVMNKIVTHHISGITTKKFLGWPLHPSQKLHCCSWIWTPVHLDRSEQFSVTFRSAVISAKEICLLLLHKKSHKHLATQTGTEICFCSLCFSQFLLALQRMPRGYPHDWSRPWAVNTEPKYGLRPPQNRVISKKYEGGTKNRKATLTNKYRQGHQR